MIYWQLFLSFLQVGMFSVGGGYAAMPLIQSQVVEQHPWLTMQEFTDLITIAEMTPGPIAVNAATFVGLRMASFPGAVIATLGASRRRWCSSRCWRISTAGIRISRCCKMCWPVCDLWLWL